MIFKNKKQIIEFAKQKWNIPFASNYDKNNWNYAYDIIYSPSFLLKKNVFLFKNKNILYCIINYKYNIYGKLLFIIKRKKQILTVSPSELYFCDINPFSEKISIFHLNPSRGGKFIFKNGFYIEEIQYKQLYYSTEEYLKKFRKGLNKNFNTVGIKSPIEIKSVREKINSTMNERYGVNWFGESLQYYESIKKKYIKKYGIENFSKYLTSSKLELEVVDFIVNDKRIKLSKDIFYLSEKTNQYIFKLQSGKNVRVDFYDKKNNIVIEVNGDFFHCNPIKYNANFTVKFFNNKKAKQIWKEDKERHNFLKKEFGCKIFVIWEHDWNNNKTKVINNLIKIFKNDNC